MTPPVKLLTARLEASLAMENQMRETPTTIERVIVSLCTACIDGIGKECHNPECALCRHAVDLPIHRELLEQPAAEFLRGWQAAIAAADALVMETNADGWGYQYPTHPELAAAIRGLVP